MTYENMEITIHLSSPMIRNHSSTLDAILGGILWSSREVDGPTAGRCEMIDRWNNVPMASEIIWPSDYTTKTEFFSRIMKRQTMIEPHLMDKVYLGKNPVYGGDGPGASGHQDYMKASAHRMITANAIKFFARGDKAEIERALIGAGFIGTRNAVGNGQIRYIEFNHCDDGELTGIVHDGKLLRPVPEQLMDLLPGIKGRRSHGMWQNPYSPKLAAQYGGKPEMIHSPTVEFLTDEYFE